MFKLQTPTVETGPAKHKLKIAGTEENIEEVVEAEYEMVKERKPLIQQELPFEGPDEEVNATMMGGVFLFFNYGQQMALQWYRGMPLRQEGPKDISIMLLTKDAQIMPEQMHVDEIKQWETPRDVNGYTRFRLDNPLFGPYKGGWRYTADPISWLGRGEGFEAAYYALHAKTGNLLGVGLIDGTHEMLEGKQGVARVKNYRVKDLQRLVIQWSERGIFFGGQQKP